MLRTSTNGAIWESSQHIGCLRSVYRKWKYWSSRSYQSLKHRLYFILITQLVDWRCGLDLGGIDMWRGGDDTDQKANRKDINWRATVSPTLLLYPSNEVCRFIAHWGEEGTLNTRKNHFRTLSWRLTPIIIPTRRGRAYVHVTLYLPLSLRKLLGMPQMEVINHDFTPYRSTALIKTPDPRTSLFSRTHTTKIISQSYLTNTLSAIGILHPTSCSSFDVPCSHYWGFYFITTITINV